MKTLEELVEEWAEASELIESKLHRLQRPADAALWLSKIVEILQMLEVLNTVERNRTHGSRKDWCTR